MRKLVVVAVLAALVCSPSLAGEGADIPAEVRELVNQMHKKLLRMEAEVDEADARLEEIGRELDKVRAQRACS